MKILVFQSALFFSLFLFKIVGYTQIINPLEINTIPTNVVLSNPLDSTSIFYMDIGGYGELWSPSFSTGLTGCLEIRIKQMLDVGFGFRKGIYDMHKKNTNFQENYGKTQYSFFHPVDGPLLMRELNPYVTIYPYNRIVNRSNIKVILATFNNGKTSTSVYAKVKGESLVKAGFRLGFISFASNYGERRDGGEIPTTNPNVNISWPGFTSLKMNLLTFGGIMQLVDNITINSTYGIKSKKLIRSVLVDVMLATNYSFSDVQVYENIGMSSSNTIIRKYYKIPDDVSFRRLGMKIAYMGQPFDGFNFTTKIEGGIRPGFNTGELKNNMFANLVFAFSFSK